MDEDRKQFVRDNAVVLIKQKEAKIKRQAKIITRLHKVCKSLQTELRRCPLNLT